MECKCNVSCKGGLANQIESIKPIFPFKAQISKTNYLSVVTVVVTKPETRDGNWGKQLRNKGLRAKQKCGPSKHYCFVGNALHLDGHVGIPECLLCRRLPLAHLRSCDEFPHYLCQIAAGRGNATLGASAKLTSNVKPHLDSEKT